MKGNKRKYKHVKKNEKHDKILNLFKQYSKMKTNWKSTTLKTYLYRLKAIDFSSTMKLVDSMAMVRITHAPKTYNNTINALTNVRKALVFFNQFDNYVKILLELEEQRITNPHVNHTEPHTKEEAMEILNYRSGYFHMIFWIAFNMGLRAEEIEKLDVIDVDFKNEILTIRESKHDKTRRIPLVAPEKWLEYKKVRDVHERNGLISGDHFLFNSKGNRPDLTSSGGIFNSAKYGGKRRPGLGYYPSIHRARAYFITNSLRNGMDIDIVAAFAGHENIGTTQGYVHTSMNELRKQIKKVGVLTDQ